MTIIKNIHPLNAEKIYDGLKKECPNYINHKLNSDLSIDFTHLYDIINILFTEIIEGIAFTITVTLDEIRLTENAENPIYQTELLKKHLIKFIKIKAA